MTYLRREVRKDACHCRTYDLTPTGAYAVLGWHQGDLLIVTDAVGSGVAASGEVAVV